MKFYPYKRKGERVFFSRAEGGGGRKSCEVVLTWEFEILSLVMRGGAQKVLPCLEEGGGRKKFLIHNFPIL